MVHHGQMADRKRYHRSRNCCWIPLVVRYVTNTASTKVDTPIVPDENDYSIPTLNGTHTAPRDTLVDSYNNHHLPGAGTTTNHSLTPGFHVPNVRHRDLYYAKLEDKRAESLGRS
jgi:hypothetical protein